MACSRFEYLNKDQRSISSITLTVCCTDGLCVKTWGVCVSHLISMPLLSGIPSLVSFYSNLLILLRFSFRLFFCVVRPISSRTFAQNVPRSFHLEWILNEHQSNLKHYRHSIGAFFSTLCVTIISFFIPVWNWAYHSKALIFFSELNSEYTGVYTRTHIVQLENYIWSM